MGNQWRSKPSKAMETNPVKDYGETKKTVGGSRALWKQNRRNQWSPKGSETNPKKDNGKTKKTMGGTRRIMEATQKKPMGTQREPISLYVQSWQITPHFIDSRRDMIPFIGEPSPSLGSSLWFPWFPRWLPSFPPLLTHMAPLWTSLRCVRL